MAFGTGTGRDVYYVAESTFATTPATPSFIHMRTTGGSLQLDKTAEESPEINSNRQTNKLIYGPESVAGDLAFVLSSGSHDDFLEMALMGTWTSDVLKVGSTLKTKAINEFHSDINQQIISNGCAVNTMSLSITTSAITGTFSMLGKTQSRTPVAGSTFGSPTTTDVVDGFSGTFLIDGLSAATITQIDLSVANNLEVRNALGGADIDHKYGRSNITGTMSMYFEDLAMFDKFIAEDSISISAEFTDGTNTLTFLIPKATPSNVDRPVDGDADIILSIPFTALYDDTQSSSLVVTRS